MLENEKNQNQIPIQEDSIKNTMNELMVCKTLLEKERKTRQTDVLKRQLSEFHLQLVQVCLYQMDQILIHS